MSFADRTVLVTGGVTGIGGAIARAFAVEGASVLILSLSVPAHGEEVKHFAAPEDGELFAVELKKHGAAATLVEGDAANEQDVARAVALGDSMDGVDILVCNAATNCIHGIADHEVALWRRVIDVNLVGPFLAIRACLPGMIERGYGRIVSIGSVAAHLGLPGYSAYCASKHGLLGLHRSAARETEGANITINTVSPGLVDTPSAHLHLARSAVDRGVTYEQVLAEELALSHQARPVTPEEVADVVLFVCGPKGRAIHGADLPVCASHSG